MVWVAVRFEDYDRQGSKNPLILECVRGAERRRLFVKCARSDREFGEPQLAAEVVSATLAGSLGISVADPCVVILDGQHLEHINDSLAAKGANFTVSGGYAAGAEHYSGLVPVSGLADLAPRHRRSASLLYAFDLASENYDRSAWNPNFGIHDGEVFAFDFELCFPSSVGPQFYAAGIPAWQVGNVTWRDLQMVRPYFRKHKFDYAAVTEEFGLWTDEWWSQNRPYLPTEWNGYADNIWGHAREIAPNVDRFVKELEVSLI